MSFVCVGIGYESVASVEELSPTIVAFPQRHTQ